MYYSVYVDVGILAEATRAPPGKVYKNMLCGIFVHCIIVTRDPPCVIVDCCKVGTFTAHKLASLRLMMVGGITRTASFAMVFQ